MARCHLRHPVTDAAGNAVQNLLSTAYVGGTLVLDGNGAVTAGTLVDDMFAAATGGAAITTLTTNNQGELEAWLTDPQTIDLYQTDNGDTAFYPAAPSSLLTFTPFKETIEVAMAPDRVLAHGPAAPTVVATVAHVDLDGPRGVWVHGRYAYVVTIGGAFVVVDVADPAAPVVVGSVTDTATMFGRSVQVCGRYAYMLANPQSSPDYFTVIDVADPTNPTIVGTLTDSLLASGHGIWVSGGYAYCCCPVPDSFLVVDITDPTAPTIVASLVDAVTLADCNRVAVQGIYAYVSCSGADSVHAIDISDPLNPVIVGTVTDSTFLDGARGVQVSGRYVYVCTAPGDHFTVIDFVDPTTPVIVGSVTGPELDGSRDLFVTGRYAYCVTATADSLTVVDVIDPTNPTVVGFITSLGSSDPDLDQAHDIYVAGRYAYVTSLAGDRLLIIDTIGTQIDALAVDQLHVTGSIATDRLEVATSLNVGPSGIFSDGPIVTPKIRAQSLVVPALQGGRAKSTSGGGTAYTVPGVEISSIGTTVLGSNQIRYAPFNPGSAINLFEAAFEVTVAPASDCLVRIGIYAANFNLQPTDGPLLDTEVAVATGFVGVKTATIDVDLEPGMYVAAWNNTVAFTARVWQGGTKFVGLNPALGTSSFNARMTVNTTYGPYPNPGEQFTGYAVSASPAQNLLLFRVSTPA